MFSAKFFFALGGVTSSKWSYMPWIDPKSDSSFIAVFIPIPGIPGILSEESPCNAFISGTNSGPSPPYLSLTAFMSKIDDFWKLEFMKTLVVPDTNCRVSESPVRITVLRFVSSA